MILFFCRWGQSPSLMAVGILRYLVWNELIYVPSSLVTSWDHMQGVLQRHACSRTLFRYLLITSKKINDKHFSFHIKYIFGNVFVKQFLSDLLDGFTVAKPPASGKIDVSLFFAALWRFVDLRGTDHWSLLHRVVSFCWRMHKSATAKRVSPHGQISEDDGPTFRKAIRLAFATMPPSHSGIIYSFVHRLCAVWLSSLLAVDNMPLLKIFFFQSVKAIILAAR